MSLRVKLILLAVAVAITLGFAGIFGSILSEMFGFNWSAGQKSGFGFIALLIIFLVSVGSLKIEIFDRIKKELEIFNPLAN